MELTRSRSLRKVTSKIVKREMWQRMSHKMQKTGPWRHTKRRLNNFVFYDWCSCQKKAWLLSCHASSILFFWWGESNNKDLETCFLCVCFFPANESLYLPCTMCPLKASIIWLHFSLDSMRQNPTPRLTPLLSRRIRVEMTVPNGENIPSKSFSFMNVGRLAMYKLVGSCSCCWKYVVEI